MQAPSQTARRSAPGHLARVESCLARRVRTQRAAVLSPAPLPATLARMTSRSTRSPSSARLGVAIKPNLTALFRARACTLEGDVLETDSVCLHHSFPHNPTFKGVWATHLAKGDVDAAIDQAIAWFEARDAP